MTEFGGTRASKSRLSAGVVRIALILLAMLIGLGAAAAQTTPLRPEEQPRRDIEGAAAGTRAAQESQDILESSGPPITYEEVMAHPDDIELNYRYALQQARAGDLRAAATTLERILLVDSRLPQVRLLYAIVLFRLDSLDEAAREFNAVQQLPVSDEVHRAVDRYLSQIALRQKTTRTAVSLSLGGAYDSNKDLVPRSETRLFADTPFVVPGGRRDFSRLAIGTFDIRRDLHDQERDEAIARGTLYYDHQNRVSDLSLQALAVEFGGVIRRDIATFTPTLTYTNINLAGSAYLSSPGLRLRTERTLDNRTDAFVVIETAKDVYSPNFVSPIVVGQSGWRSTIQAGANYAIDPTMRVGLAYRHTRDNAEENFFAYDTDEIGISHTWLLGRGQFLLSTATYGIDRYDAPNPAVSAGDRRDNTLRIRSTYGVPLDTLSLAVKAGTLPEAIGDIVLSAGVEADWAQSTIANFAYTNYRVEVFVTKRWEF
ncbi:MAG TPA: hypothetical protein VEU47_15020 [Candidatus Cybelea sp.]|nr:hypothetical protein [Candidatus Cybelea sp.]